MHYKKDLLMHHFFKIALLLILSFTFTAAQAGSTWVRLKVGSQTVDGSYSIIVDSNIVKSLERDGFYYLDSYFKEYFKAIGSSNFVVSHTRDYSMNTITTIPFTERAPGEYYYRLEIESEDETGEEFSFKYQSNTITVSLQKPLPPNVRSNRTTSTDGDYEIWWSAVEHAETYEWSEKIGGGSWRQNSIYQAYEDEETIEEFENQQNNTYSYRARACNDAGCSAYSAIKTVVVDLTTIDLPYAEGFESNLGGWESNGVYRWSRDASGTPSSGTGPSRASVGSYYMYMETSGGASNRAGNTAILVSPYFDTGGTNISFDYHMYGSNIGTLSLEININGNWVSLWTKSGQQHTSNSAAWTNVSVSLSDYSGIHQLRFKGVAAGGYRGDMAIDNIKIARVSDERRKVTFIHTDLLGTPVAETDDKGIIQGAE